MSNVIKAMYTKVKSLVRCNNVMSDSFESLQGVKGSVTICYLYVYCLFMSLFAKKSIRFRYIKLYINTFVMIIRILSQEESIFN